MKPNPIRVPGLFPEKFLPNGLLATRANMKKFMYDVRRNHARQSRRVEYLTDDSGSYILDKDGHKIPHRVLHETKGWQNARVAL